jgi:hypothetical protein
MRVVDQPTRAHFRHVEVGAVEVACLNEVLPVADVDGTGIGSLNETVRLLALEPRLHEDPSKLALV